MNLPVTPRYLAILELAVGEARKRGDNYVGAEHLALAIVREGESIPAGVFYNDFGVTYDGFQAVMYEILDRPDRPQVVVR